MDGSIPSSRTTFRTLQIREVRRETDEAVVVVFDLPPALRPAFAFRPGQYLTLRAVIDGVEIRRSYSICTGIGAFERSGELAVAIKRVQGGLFSCFANDRLRAGDTIDVLPPEGRFGPVLDPNAARLHLGIAAGSGITPILSIAESVLEREKSSRFVLVYGNRSTASILFRTAIEDLKDRYLDRLTVLHVLSRETQDLALLNGRIDTARIEALAARLFDPTAVDQAYVCGPGEMLLEAETALRSLGTPAEAIHVERFTTGGLSRAPARNIVTDEGVEAPVARATFILNGVATEIAVAPGEALLDAGLRAGLDLPWSCRGGMCCTCRARLDKGSATMEQNFSLEPAETAAGFILTCQARPTSPVVVVDYDAI